MLLQWYLQNRQYSADLGIPSIVYERWIHFNVHLV